MSRFRSIFLVCLKEFRAEGLPAKDRSGSSDPFLKCNFDHFKRFKTKVISKSVNPVWTGFEISFTYETHYVDRLQRKVFRVDCFDRDRITSNDFIGLVEVDLHTLATGPTQHELILRNGGNPAGTLYFTCTMDHRTDVAVSLSDISVHNLAGGEKEDGSMSCRLGYSYSGKDAQKAVVSKKAKAKAGKSPRWDHVPQLFFPTVLKDMIAEAINLEVRVSHHKALHKTLGEARIEMRKYLNVTGQMIRFKEELHGALTAPGTSEPYIEGWIHFYNVPRFANMVGGRQIGTGFDGGQLLLRDLEVPFGMRSSHRGHHHHRRRHGHRNHRDRGDREGDDAEETPKHGGSSDQESTDSHDGSASSSSEAAPVMLKPGFERKKHPDGRTYYVDHAARETSWSVPPGAILENVPPNASRSISKSKKLSAFGGTENGATKERSSSRSKREHKSEGSGREREKRQMKEEVMSKPEKEEKSENSSQLAPGWEQRFTKDGKPFYIDHNEKRTYWVLPDNGLVGGGELPEGWEQREMEDGRLLFVNHLTKETTWDHPRGKGPLPPGWIEQKDSSGKIFYVNMIEKTTQWDDPRK